MSGVKHLIKSAYVAYGCSFERWTSRGVRTTVLVDVVTDVITNDSLPSVLSTKSTNCA